MERRAPTGRNFAARVGGWSAHHARSAIVGWVAFVVAATALGMATGQRALTDVEMGNGESRQAISVLNQAFPYHTPEQVLVQGTGALGANSPATVAAVRDLVGRLRTMSTVSQIRSPLGPGGVALRSADGRSLLVTFRVAGTFASSQDNVLLPLAAVSAVAKAHPSVVLAEFGAASAQRAIKAAFMHDFQRSEYTSVPVTLVILLFAFGALVAASLPLALGFTAVLAAIGLLAPLTYLVPVTSGQIDAVVMLIGLAVGVDYSLFYLRRKLEERRAGLDGEHALARAAATSGQAVVVSGLTVMTAMAGMFLAGNAIFSGLALGTMLVVAIAVAGSVTVLPALMAVLGDSVERGRIPFLSRPRGQGRSRAWDWIISRVVARPVVAVVVSAGFLLALAMPALSMRTVDPGMVGMPPGLPIMQTYARIQQAFPGGPIPATVVVKAPDVTAPRVATTLKALATRALATGQMGGPVLVAVSRDRTVATLTLSLAGKGTDAKSNAALDTLRHRLIPATIGAAPGAHAWVSGQTAASEDFNASVGAHLPYVIGFVLGLAFVLLLITFRSIVIPIKTIILNLLSVGAAYGIVTLIFQDGYGRSLLGATDVSGVVDWLPVFLFVVLFGLSMDYHVLILSRVKENHEGGMTTRTAVAEGLKATAGVVTSAALVMVAVFSVFMVLPELPFKQLGLGLAVAVLIDATIVRAVLLPAAMTLLGEWNWYLPPSLRRIRLRRRHGHASPA